MRISSSPAVKTRSAWITRSSGATRSRCSSESGRRQWPDALSLYRGEVLDGMYPDGVAPEFQEWLDTQRRSMRELAARAAWETSRAEEERGDRGAAVAMARRARELDPDNEEGVRRLMELLDRRGDRSGALKVYGEWQARLLEDYGVEPAPETRKLANRVRAARKGESHETPPTMLKPVQVLPVSGPGTRRDRRAAARQASPNDRCRRCDRDPAGRDRPPPCSGRTRRGARAPARTRCPYCRSERSEAPSCSNMLMRSRKK